MRAKLKVIGSSVLGVGGVSLGIASQVSATQAAYNLASYFKVAGVTALPKMIAGVPIDVIGSVLAVALVVGAVVWLFWPQESVASAAPAPQSIVIDVRYPSVPDPTSPPTFAPPPDGRYIVGARLEDELGTTFGPTPLAEALAHWKEVDGDYVPLDEAAAWLYEQAPDGLRAVLQDHRPFANITANAAAHIGAAADAGIGGFYGRRERGFPLEPLKYKDSREAWPSSDGRHLWKGSLTDPSVRRADLPLFLKYYADAVPGPVMEVRRDKDLREGVGWVVYREWGHTPETSGGGRLSDFSEAWNLIHQAARDGDVTIWAKPDSPHNLFEQIRPEFWRDHNVDFLRLWYPSDEVQTRTTANNQMAVGNYVELMTSSAEFEAEWPRP